MLQILLSIIALLVIAITMFVSASDFKLRGSWRWHARRAGFVAAGAAAAGLILYLIFGHYPPEWLNALLYIGVALFLVTNPNQIPWHKWIWKGDNGGAT